MKNLAVCFLFIANIKGTFLGLRQFLTYKSPLKMMKNAFYFMIKDFFVLKTFFPEFLITSESSLIKS